MVWTPKKRKYDWRKFLTAEERVTIRLADDAKAKWRELNQSRALITNRAIHRAIEADTKGEGHG